MSGNYGFPPSNGEPPVGYALNSKIMIAAIVVLFLVVFFILSLHVYAKWFWRHSSARNASSRRRRRLDFTGQEHFVGGENVGLDKATIDSLPMFVYKPPQTDEAVLECAVCLCEFEEAEKGRLLPKCNHSFHTECIDMWLHSHSTCPLCRTSAKPEAQQDCNPPTEPASPSLPPQQLGGSEEQRLGQIEVVEVISGSSLLLSTENRGSGEDEEGVSVHNQSIPYPTRVLFWGDHVHVSSRLSSPSMGREFSSTRSLPRMAVDIPCRRTADAFSSPRCLSLNLTRCPSRDDQACSSPRGQPLKSPSSMGMSIKRLLSRERRVFPSGQEGAEFDQDTTVSPV